ncbi:MAG: TolC family protein [Chlorobi bacterium]|nr:TolC family protein [Chlorobiota bacterium]
MRKNIFMKILFVAFSFSAAISINAQSGRIVSLKTCIDSALANHPSLKAFKKMEESKAANTKSLEKQILPELDFAFQGQYNLYEGYNYGTLDNRLRLVWDMGKWTGELQRAGVAEEKIAEFKSEKNKLDLIYRVKSAYYGLINAEKTLSIAKLSEKYLEHHLSINKKLYDIGQIKRLDYYFTQSALSRAKENTLTARSAIESWQIELTNLTGFNITSADSLEIPDELILEKNYSLDRLLADAVRFNPAVSVLDKQIELAEVRADLVSASKMPKIYIGGGYVFDGDPTSDGNYGAFSGGLLIPIFDWGTRSKKSESLMLEAESINSTKKTLLLQIKTKLNSLVNRIEENVKKILALKDTSIAQTQKTYDLTLINYKAGISTNTDVLLAQKALIELKASKEKLIFTLYELNAQIENIIGQPEELQ